MRLLLALVLATLVAPRPADAQVMIKVDDNTNFKIGILLQPWADWTQDGAAAGGYAQNLYLRRVRLLVGGQIMPGVTFFAETDNPNLGKATTAGATTTKTISSGLTMQDAYLEWKPNPASNAFMLQGGLMLVPLCRDCLTSAAAHMALDYGTWSFQQSGVTQSVVGRDTGFQLHGYVAGNHREYRAGAYQGLREGPGSTGAQGSHNAFRYAGRVQYAFLETETVPFFYTSTYFGKKKFLSVGGAFDVQEDYRAYAADVFFDYPVAGGGVSLEGDFIHYDGGTTFTGLKSQNDVMFQGGYFSASTKLFPYVRYERLHFRNPGNDLIKYQLGLGYFLKGQNINFKGAYTRLDPRAGKATNQLTFQIQAFIF